MLPFGDCDYYDKSDAKEHIYTFHPKKNEERKKSAGRKSKRQLIQERYDDDNSNNKQQQISAHARFMPIIIIYD